MRSYLGFLVPKTFSLAQSRCMSFGRYMPLALLGYVCLWHVISKNNAKQKTKTTRHSRKERLQSKLITLSFGAKPLYVLWTLYAFGVVIVCVPLARCSLE